MLPSVLIGRNIVVQFTHNRTAEDTGNNYFGQIIASINKGEHASLYLELLESLMVKLISRRLVLSEQPRALQAGIPSFESKRNFDKWIDKS